MSERPGAETDHNRPVLTVSEVSQSLKHTVEGAFQFVRVKGEVSGFKRAASGHLYFSLKDADAVLDGVCWRGSAGRLGLDPEDGMEVVASGRLTTYAQRSRYQIVVERMELAGEGALLKLLEERRRKLAAEGLFDDARKRDIPFLPDVIGVVTSPTGAVLRDILHRLADRFGRHVVLWPVLVQGEAAAAQIAAAVDGFNRLVAGGAVPRPDVLIVGRGGGSLEDLWAFNDEAVVRAVAASAIPVISAVGHETDTTLIDFAADRRAPTPTAAAEMAVPVRLELLAQVADDGGRLVAALTRLLAERRTRLDGLVRGLPNLGRLVEERAQRLDDWAERLANGLRLGLASRAQRLALLTAGLPDARQRIARAADRVGAATRGLAPALRAVLTGRGAELARLGDLLESYSYQGVLGRGFALVSDSAGGLVASAGDATPGEPLELRFHDGTAAVTVDSAQPGAQPGTKGGTGKRGKRKPADGRQGELL